MTASSAVAGSVYEYGEKG